VLSTKPHGASCGTASAPSTRSTFPQPVTASTWSRLLDEASPVNGYVAELDDKVVGFANCVLHPYTWGANPVCYLEDLYVDPSVRGSGVGLALMEHLVELAAVNGWARIYWHTDRENTPARRLYDQLGPADEIVRYTLVANEEHPPRSGPAL